MSYSRCAVLGAIGMLFVLLSGCAVRPTEGAMLYGSRLYLYRFPDAATCERLLAKAAEEIRGAGGSATWTCEDAP